MEIKEKTIRYIEVDGINFYKSASGYWFGSKSGCVPKRLHVYVWEKHNGKIPNGSHIHHIDGNKDNNEIENLQLVTKKEHDDIHASERSTNGKSIIEKARAGAVAWHKSEAGLEWHKKHYTLCTEGVWSEKVSKKCAVCGKEYEVKAMVADKSQYCSDTCKATARRNSEVDNVFRPCDTCGTPIWTNKYAPKRFCSIACRPKRRYTHTNA